MRCVTNCYTQLPHDIIFLSFSFQYLLKTTQVTVGAVQVVMSFILWVKPDILRAVAEQGYREPTLFSSRRSAVLEGRDLMASAQTGTGKTARLYAAAVATPDTRQPHAKGRRPVRALILTPTRELAAQVVKTSVITANT